MFSVDWLVIKWAQEVEGEGVLQNKSPSRLTLLNQCNTCRFNFLIADGGENQNWRFLQDTDDDDDDTKLWATSGRKADAPVFLLRRHL